MFNFRRLLPFLSILLIVVAALTLASVDRASGNSQIIAHARFQNWEYTSMQDADGSLITQVSYQHDSPLALQQYVQENKRLADALAKDGVAQADVTITFDRALSLADFNKWQASQPLEVRSYTMRLLGKDNERITIGGSPTENGLVDEAALKRILDHLAERGASDLRGVFSVEGILRLGDYDRIANAPMVFLVDITGTFANHEIAKSISLSKANQYSNVPSAFWYLEDLNLAK